MVYTTSPRYFGTFDRKILNVRQKILDRSKIFSESIQKNFWNVPKFLPERSKISYGCAVFPSGRSKCQLPMRSACCKPCVFVLKKCLVPLHTRAKISYRGNVKIKTHFPAPGSSMCSIGNGRPEGSVASRPVTSNPRLR